MYSFIIYLGYRPVPNTLKNALISAFYPHNEFLNFWTHFLPALDMLWRLILYFSSSSSSCSEKLPMLIFQVRITL